MLKGLQRCLCGFLAVLLLAGWNGCANENACANAGRILARSWQGTSFQQMDVGLCEDYPSRARSLARARHDLEVCRSTGAKVLRIAFSWLEMEHQPGTVDFSFWDAFVTMATDEFHIRLIPYVCYTPRWAAPPGAGDGFWHSPPRDPEMFGQFMRILVRHYKSRIHSWELWNEPDNPAYWTGTVEDYARLVKAGSRAVREEDPVAKVVLGGIAGTVSFVARLFREQHIAPAIDVVNAHAYYETWNEDAIERIPEYVGKIADVIAQWGSRQRIWLAEVGYSDFRKSGGYVSEQYVSRFAFEHTAAFQGDVILRAAALARSTNKVDVFAWYRINDLPESQEVIGDVNNLHLGIMDVHGAEKPGVSAFRETVQLFGAKEACVDDQIAVVRRLAGGGELHAFLGARSTLTIIGWERVSLSGEGRRNGEEQAGAEERAVVIMPSAGASGTKCVAMGLSRNHIQVVHLRLNGIFPRGTR
ncbi:MAG: GH39 family glycosyl hydrolase [Phycisphaerae bacterium]